MPVLNKHGLQAGKIKRVNYLIETLTSGNERQAYNAPINHIKIKQITLFISTLSLRFLHLSYRAKKQNPQQK